MQSAAGHSLLGVVPAGLAWLKCLDLCFLKRLNLPVVLARGLATFLRFWVHIWIEPYQGDGCPPIKALGRFALP